MMMISNVFVRFLIGSQVGFSQGAKSNSNHGVSVLPSYIRCAGRPGLERCVQGDLGWWRRSSLAGPGSAMRATLPLWGTCTSHSAHWQLAHRDAHAHWAQPGERGLMRLLCLTNDIWSQQQGEGDNSNVMKLLLCHDNQIGLHQSSRFNCRYAWMHVCTCSGGDGILIGVLHMYDSCVDVLLLKLINYPITTQGSDISLIMAWLMSRVSPLFILVTVTQIQSSLYTCN